MNQTQSSTISRSKTYEITITALMTAVTCILAPMSIPIGPVPISFTNLAIYLSLYLLGWKKAPLPKKAAVLAFLRYVNYNETDY